MTVALILLGPIVAVIIIMFFRAYYVKAKLQRLALKKYATMKAFIDKLATNTSVTHDELLEIAEKPSLRLALFHALKAYNRGEDFPMDFHTEEKGAESYMVNWLEFPTELGQSPDEILLLKIIPLELQATVHYYVFKFKTQQPRWAKNLNWMIGVCGPYNNNSGPFDVPHRVYSRFNRIEDVSPELEVKWVHENISPEPS